MSIPTTQKQWQLPSAGVGIEGIALVRDAPVPVPGPKEVLVKIRATSINYRDLFLAQYNAIACTPNVVFLSDAAGDVVAVGADVSKYRVGDRVSAGINPGFRTGSDGMLNPGLPPCRGGDAPGTLTQFQVFDESDLVNVPAHMTYEQAATLPCAGVTAWTALYGGKGLRPGQTVVVQGTGGVSLIAAQIAKCAGCRVIATSSSDEKLKRLVQMGIAEEKDVINYRKVPNWGSHVKQALTKGIGADFVLDVVGAFGWEQNIAAAKRGGEIALVGQLDNDPSKTTGITNTLGAVMNLNTLRGVLCGPLEDYARLMACFEAHKVEPIVDRVFEFEDAIEALRCAKRGDFFGKVVLRVD